MGSVAAAGAGDSTRGKRNRRPAQFAATQPTRGGRARGARPARGGRSMDTAARFRRERGAIGRADARAFPGLARDIAEPRTECAVVAPAVRRRFRHLWGQRVPGALAAVARQGRAAASNAASEGSARGCSGVGLRTSRHMIDRGGDEVVFDPERRIWLYQANVDGRRSE